MLWVKCCGDSVVWCDFYYIHLFCLSYFSWHSTLCKHINHPYSSCLALTIVLVPSLSPPFPVCRLIGLYINISQCHFCGLQLVLWLQLHSHKNEHWQVWLATASGTVNLWFPLCLFFLFCFVFLSFSLLSWVFPSLLILLSSSVICLSTTSCLVSNCFHHIAFNLITTHKLPEAT